MYITTNIEAVKKLSSNYTVLELDTIQQGDRSVTAYCVIDAEQIPIMDIPLLEQHKALHQDFINEYKKGNYKYCLDAVEYLKNCFGGEVNSFYDHVIERINSKLSNP